MNTHRSRHLRLAPIAAGLAAIFACASAPANAAIHNVLTCDDDGPGSLRAVVAALTPQQSGDTINLTGLSCGTISLSTGGIAIALDDLTLIGPGASQLTIERAAGMGKQRVFRHEGTGTLNLGYLTVSNGYYGGPAVDQVNGGCIFSQGTVALDHARVSGCTASAANLAFGGGVYAGAITLNRSTLSGNTAKVQAGATSAARGGGAAASTIEATASSITGNSATGSFASDGGGLASASASIVASTISGNQADGHGGGIATENLCTGLCVPTSAIINNSTVSGNSANITGGFYTRAVTATVRNSTIAFNTAFAGAGILNGNLQHFAAGLFSYGSPVDIESVLIANNAYGDPAVDSDLSVYAAPSAVSGANNLIREGNGDAPSGSMHGACPLLGPLRDNGGLTKTHALLSGSPGIDAGSNISPDLPYDQRLAPNVRDNGFPDIGAYEIQAEIIFASGMDGCTALP
ncbi:MAG TPA: choice-of-anchor Q domain-containing protein [Rudaea sp.]|jgi:hypothetical protein